MKTKAHFETVQTKGNRFWKWKPILKQFLSIFHFPSCIDQPCWWKRQFSKVFHFCQSQRTDFKDDWDSSFQWILKDDGNNWFYVIFIWIDNFHRIFVFVRTGGQISKLIGTRAFNKFLKMMGTIDSKWLLLG